MKILCREPVSVWTGSYGHPLGVPYDEQDSMLFFDNVLVPWDRVFMLYDSAPLLRDFAAGINFSEWANLCRIHERMKLMTAVATMIAEAIGVLEYREVAAKVGEMVTYTEMWHHAMDGVEHGARMGEGGVMSLGSMSGMNIYFSQTSARMVQLLREVSGSGLIMQPSENDLANPDWAPQAGGVVSLESVANRSFGRPVLKRRPDPGGWLAGWWPLPGWLSGWPA